ncbi:MAG: flagellar basal-body rod protein FlgB [Candidatus Midichloriaceae bacterium]|jgi:flagellar basal-body rod protein FlgB
MIKKCKILLVIFTYFLFTKITIANENLMNLYKKQLSYLSKNDSTIGLNIANSDTPKFKPKKLNLNKQTVYDMSLTTTNPLHIHDEEKSGMYVIATEDITEIKPNGNAVDIEKELLKKSENSIKLHQIANMYTKSKEMLKHSLSGGAR